MERITVKFRCQGDVRRMIRYLRYILAILFLLHTHAIALIEVDITRGNLNPLPIAVSPLFQNDNSKKQSQKKLSLEDLGLEISKVIENNLKQSG